MLLHSISIGQAASGKPWVVRGGSGGRVKRRLRGWSRRRKELGLEQNQRRIHVTAAL
jgi:hypothetical protein